MRKLSLVVVVGVLATGLMASSSAQRVSTVKALVGGTLIDGYGGRPIRNSVVLDRGRAHRGRRSGRHACGPAGRRRDLHRRHERAARALGHARAPHDQRPRRLRPLGQDLSRGSSSRDHAGVGQAAADGRRDERARPRRAARGQSSRSAIASTRERFPAPTLYVSGRSSSTRRIRAPSCSAGA